MSVQIWLLPCLLLLTATVLAFPLSAYLASIMDSTFTPPFFLKTPEKKLDCGPQTWKQYALSILCFNTLLFITGYLILALQPWLPLNPDHKTLLSPTTLFSTVAAFMTNTDLQHYAGEAHLSIGSQIFFGFTCMFLSAATGLSAMTAMTRALRGDASCGNFFVDVWRVVVYLFVPLSLVIAVIFIQQGSPMTFTDHLTVSSLETGQPLRIAIGPVAAFESIKLLGTNGGGFFNMNAAHPFENPTALSNLLNTLSMMLIPFAVVLMYGRMLKRVRHSFVLFAIMLTLMSACIAWTVYFDTLQPNPAATAHDARQYGQFTLPAQSALPITQEAGNLEGKELRFGASAGTTYAAITAGTGSGAINAEMDSLNPLAALGPLTALWLNCIFGGDGIGMINMLVFIILGIFIAGMMVGRTPEYLGKKIGIPEVKLAILALLVHPLLILISLGLFSVMPWGRDAISNPGAHGLTQMLYQFSSASANNGSAFDGLNVVYGFYNNALPAAAAIPWDIATGLVMIFSRYLPLIAPLALAALLGAKKSVPNGPGTLRDDSLTFALLMIGIIVIIGALLYLPVATLGPVAEHIGPQPFGG